MGDDEIQKCLDELKEKHEHVTVLESDQIRAWWLLTTWGSAILFISWGLGFTNRCFTGDNPGNGYAETFFPAMTWVAFGGNMALLMHVLIYDSYAKFCTVAHAYNHMLETCMIFAFRAGWWLSIQGMTLFESNWFWFPALVCFALEFAFYITGLWGRHLAFCSEYEKAHEEFPVKVANFLFFLDVLWMGTQFAAVSVLIWYDDELSTNPPPGCE